MVAVYANVEGQPADTPWARFFFAVMDRRGASQNSIHAATGIAASTIGDWIYNGKEPKTRTLEKIAPWLHMEVAELWAIVYGEISTDEALARYTNAYAELDDEIAQWMALGQRIRDRIRRLGWGT